MNNNERFEQDKKALTKELTDLQKLISETK